MPRTILAILPLLAVSAVAQQQLPAPDPASTIEKQRKDSLALAGEWLHSQDPRTRAWGAYLVLRDRLTDRVPDLLSLAENYTVTGEPASLTESDDHDAMLSVLDSLIQMRVDVPTDNAVKLYPEFPAHAVILMANSPSDNVSAFLRIFQTERLRNGAWLATGNVLVEHRAPGFAAAVLSSLVVHAQISVTDGNSFGHGYGGSFCGGGLSAPRVGWPEIGSYLLSACGATQKTVLVNGVHPAYYWRSVNNSYHSGSESTCPGADRDEIRADYVATLLNSGHDQVPIPSQVDRSIIWTDSATYLSELTQFIADEQTLFSETARHLVSAGLITEAEVSASRPTLDITVTDARRTKLPELPSLPAAIDGVLLHN